MMIDNRIELFLSAVEGISIGFSAFDFFALGNFAEGQIGYRNDVEGNSLITGHEGSWEESWFVVAYDSLGDPIFVDISNEELPVFTAEDGDEEWNPILLATSLANFKNILQELRIISVGRQSPEQMEKYPIPKKMLKQFLKEVKEANAGVEIWWWEMFFDIGDE